MHQLERLLVIRSAGAPVLEVLGQRDWLDGYRRLHPIHADSKMRGITARREARLRQRLAEVSEEGRPGRRIRQRGRWCPHGPWYEVQERP